MTCKEGRFNTRNPICSNKPQDLHDNAMIIDAFANSDADFVEDRFGVERKTISEIEREANGVIANVEDTIDQKIEEKIIAQGGVEIINNRGQASNENVFSAEYVNNIESTIKDNIEKIESRRFEINDILVSDFGDTDDLESATQCLVNAIEFRKNRGYGRVVLDRDMTIGLNDPITTDFDNFELHIPSGIIVSVTHIRFNIPSTGKGYSGGYRNWYITGRGTIRGVESNSVFYIQACHVTNIGCKGVAWEEITYSHIFDLLGCKTARFKDMSIIGSSPDIFGSERHYIEAIQTNAYSLAGAAFPDLIDENHIDYLDSIDIELDNVTVMPKYNEDGVVKTYATRPFGNHSATVVNHCKDVVIKNCKFVDVMPNPERLADNYLKDYFVSVPSASNIEFDNCEFIINDTDNFPKGFVYIVHNDKGLDENGNSGVSAIHDNMLVNFRNCSFISKSKKHAKNSQLIRVNANNSNVNYTLTVKEHNSYIDVLSDTTGVFYVTFYGDSVVSFDGSSAVTLPRFFWGGYNNFNSNKSSIVNFNALNLSNQTLNSSLIVTAGSVADQKDSISFNISNSAFVKTGAITRVNNGDLIFTGNTIRSATPSTGNTLHEVGLVMGVNSRIYNVSNNTVTYHQSSSSNFKGVFTKDGVSNNGVNNQVIQL